MKGLAEFAELIRQYPYEALFSGIFLILALSFITRHGTTSQPAPDWGDRRPCGEWGRPPKYSSSGCGPSCLIAVLLVVALLTLVAAIVVTFGDRGPF